MVAIQIFAKRTYTFAERPLFSIQASVSPSALHSPAAAAAVVHPAIWLESPSPASRISRSSLNLQLLCCCSKRVATRSGSRTVSLGMAARSTAPPSPPVPSPNVRILLLLHPYLRRSGCRARCYCNCASISSPNVEVRILWLCNWMRQTELFPPQARSMDRLPRSGG